MTRPTSLFVALLVGLLGLHPLAADTKFRPLDPPAPEATWEKDQEKRQAEEKKRREAEEKKRRDEEKRRQDERVFQDELDLLREQDLKRVRSPHEKNHDSVRRAFRETVQSVRPSTAVVLADGKQAALGAVVAADGLIATKASELRGKLEVRLVDGKKLAANVVAVSDLHDLALLKVDRQDLVPVVWADGSPAIGSWVAAAINADLPLSVGVVSVATRGLKPRGLLGIVLKPDADRALIERVMPDGAAAQAGLQVNDIITQIEGQVVTTSQKVLEFLHGKLPGTAVRLQIQRGSEQMEFTITLMAQGSLPPDRLARFERMNLIGGDLSTRRTGFPTALQHDTVLKPEECGGPLVDLEGHCVGLNIARSGRIESYAIPADAVQEFVAQRDQEKYAVTETFQRGLKQKAFAYLITETERTLRAAERERTAAEKKIAAAQKALDKARREQTEFEKK